VAISCVSLFLPATWLLCKQSSGLEAASLAIEALLIILPWREGGGGAGGGAGVMYRNSVSG
jgi:hypothetical protein